MHVRVLGRERERERVCMRICMCMHAIACACARLCVRACLLLVRCLGMQARSRVLAMIVEAR